METLLLTGGTGFVGSHLLSSFVNNFNVIVVKRSTSDISKISAIKGSFRTYDIDSVLLESIFSKYDIKYIVHTATSYGRGSADEIENYDVNEKLPQDLLNLGIKYKSLCFINTDTFSSRPKYNYKHLKSYHSSKQKICELLRLAVPGITTINMRLEHVYGPHDRRDKFVPSIINNILTKKSIDLTEGLQERDFIYIDDVINAFQVVIKSDICTSCKWHEIEVGTGKTTSIKQFVSKIKMILNKDIDLNFGVLPYRENEIKTSFANTFELNKLGWKSIISLNDGLRKTVQYEKNLLSDLTELNRI